MTAGLSGVIAAKEPGNIPSDGSRGYLAPVDSNDTKARFRAELDLHGDIPELDLLCYLICRLGGYTVDIAESRRKMDEAAKVMTPTFEGVIEALFVGPRALRGNTEDYYGVRNSMLCAVQTSGAGIPITLSVLALEHARRIDVPMVGIGLPGHFIVGSGTNHDLFADPFNGGRLLDRDGVRELHRRVTGRRDSWRESNLAPVCQRDIVFRILTNIKVACTKNFAERTNLAWVLELLSWFPQGAAFDARVAARALALFN